MFTGEAKKKVWLDKYIWLKMLVEMKTLELAIGTHFIKRATAC